VTATFYNEDRSFAGTVELKDGGPSSPPDMKMSDGVFSGTVVPMSDGNYLVFVTLKYAVPQMRYKSTRADDPLLYRTLSSGDYHVSDKAKENVLQSSPGRLFPVDQTGYMGCGSGYFGKLPISLTVVIIYFNINNCMFSTFSMPRVLE
jgi:hypothetical protein